MTSYARSALVGLGASLCLFAGCSTSPGGNKTMGTGGSIADSSTSSSAASSSGSTGGAGGATSPSSTSASASTGTGTGGGAAPGCSSFPLCDDFESDTAGSAPSSTLWSIVNEGGCGNSTSFSVQVSTAQAHSGKNSVAVVGGDSCGPLMVNTSAFPKITSGEVYGRFYVYLSANTAFNHAGMMTLGLTANANPSGMSLNQAANLELASESINNAAALTWQTTDGNILPDKDPAGGATTTYPMATTWTCVEFHASKNTGALETWINGTAVTGLTYVPGTTTKTQGVNDQWTPPSPFAPTALGLGWINFGGSSFTLYFDDVALDSSRIGCN